jgi:hypothetical protein
MGRYSQLSLWGASAVAALDPGITVQTTELIRTVNSLSICTLDLLESILRGRDVGRRKLDTNGASSFWLRCDAD